MMTSHPACWQRWVQFAGDSVTRDSPVLGLEARAWPWRKRPLLGDERSSTQESVLLSSWLRLRQHGRGSRRNATRQREALCRLRMSWAHYTQQRHRSDNTHASCTQSQSLAKRVAFGNVFLRGEWHMPKIKVREYVGLSYRYSVFLKDTHLFYRIIF